MYSLISCISVSTHRFTQNCGCFQNHSDIFFISEAYYDAGKSKCQNVNRRLNHEHIFMKPNFSGIFSSAPPLLLKTFLPCANAQWLKCTKSFALQKMKFSIKDFLGKFVHIS